MPGRLRSLAVDTRLSGNVDLAGSGHNFLVGIDYRDVDNQSGFGFTGASPIDLYNPVYGQDDIESPGITTRYNEQTVKQTGIYVQDQLALGRFLILASGRYDWVESEYVQPFTSLDVDGPILNAEQEKFTYRFGANYVTDSGLSPYASYATSFQPVLGGDSDGNAFEPTSGEQIEAGIKYDGRRLRDGIDVFGTFAVYQIIQDNVVSTGSTPNLPVFDVQLGQVEVQGLELELVTRIDDRLSLNGS